MSDPSNKSPSLIEGTPPAQELEKELSQMDSQCDSTASRTASTVAPGSTRTKAKRQCIFGEYCSLHGFIHGAEAEELRSRLEALIEEETIDAVAIQAILNDVDARDAVAYLEWVRREEAEAEDFNPEGGPGDRHTHAR